MGRAIIDYHNNLSSLHFELTLELLQPFLKKWPIHLLGSIYASEVKNVLEASWTDRFSNHKYMNLLTQGVIRSRPCYPHFAVFSTWATLTWEVQRFRWKYFSQGCLLPRCSHLFNNLFWLPRNLFESNAVSKEKMKNVVIHLTLFWFELLIKAQGKYHLPFLPASQPSVPCFKIVVMEGLSKSMSFLQKNKTIDWNVVTTHWCKRLQQVFI